MLSFQIPITLINLIKAIPAKRFINRKAYLINKNLKMVLTV